MCDAQSKSLGDDSCDTDIGLSQSGVRIAATVCLLVVVSCLRAPCDPAAQIRVVARSRPLVSKFYVRPSISEFDITSEHGFCRPWKRPVCPWAGMGINGAAPRGSDSKTIS